MSFPCEFFKIQGFETVAEINSKLEILIIKIYGLKILTKIGDYQIFSDILSINKIFMLLKITKNQKKRIILIITGSIAAYKAIDLARLIEKNGFEINIVLSKKAENFVSPEVLRVFFPNKVYSNDETLNQNGQISHISLAQSADLILIAPCTANTISKIAHGQASCLLSEIILTTKALLLVAPAMNQQMWKNPVVQYNIEKLKSIYNEKINFIGPVDGIQACGDQGIGNMSNIDDIVTQIKFALTEKLLKNKTIVITLGATKERIDPVRYITNDSSGKMGYAIAYEAAILGANVIVIAGAVSISMDNKIMKIIKIGSTQEMLEISLREAKNAHIFIGVAAVSDYKIENQSVQKIKKTDNAVTLTLIENPDIIATIKKSFPNLFVVAFAAETENIKPNGYAKLQRKKLDMIAINDVSDGKVFNNDKNSLMIFNKQGILYETGECIKEIAAKKLLELIYEEITSKQSYS